MEPESPFKLGYRWVVRGESEDVFHFISRIKTWPSWWPQIIAAKPARDDDAEIRVGDSATMQAKSLLPYKLYWHTTVLEVDEPNFIKVRGDVTLGKRMKLYGIISFTLKKDGDNIIVINSQEIYPSRPVPGMLRSVLNRVFNFNHDYAMKRGLSGLQQAVTDRAASRRGET